jgi:hypothetical protein
MVTWLCRHLLASQKNHPLAASTSLGSANLLLLPDDSDRHDDEELDADRRRPPGAGTPSDPKLLLDDLPDRRPDPLPPSLLLPFLQNTGSGKHLYAAAFSSSSMCPAARYAAPARGATSMKAVGRYCCGRRRDGDTDAERANE